MFMKKKKLMSYILACSMFLSGCKADIKSIINRVKDNLPFRDFTTSMNDFTKGNESESMEETISQIETEVIPSITETISVTEPNIEDTQSSTVLEETQVTEEVKVEETEPVSNLTEDNIMVSATTNVNIRSSNTVNSLKIGSFKMYDIAYRILCCDNNWDLVKYNNQIGYVCRDYLEYSNESYDTEYKYTMKNDIVLTTTELNFRTSPSTDGDKISRFAEYTELQVIASVDNGWLLVKNNGVLGYVHGDYTASLLDKAREEYPNLNITELDVKKIVYSTTNLNVRNGNNTDYEKIGSLEKYESVRVLYEYDDWYFVMTNDYNFGFINKTYTRDLDNTFVVVDLSEQRLYLYNKDELYFITPVTTGKDSTPSDIGLFEIYDKETNRYLVGADYKSFVNYWMPYNRGEGLHDATWRSVFGTQGYKTNGSHGCINMPLDITDDIYENVSVGTKVLVHK